MALCLKSGVSQKNWQAIIERPDKEKVLIRSNVWVLNNSKGKIAGAINFIEDVFWYRSGKASGINNFVTHQLLEKLPVSIYTVDANGGLSFYNQAAADLWGRNPVLGQEFWCGAWKVLQADGRTVTPENSPMAIAVKEQRTFLEEEMVIQRSDKSIREVMSFSSPICNECNVTIGGVNMLVDISMLKKMEKTIQHQRHNFLESAQTIEKIIAERTAALLSENKVLLLYADWLLNTTATKENCGYVLLNHEGCIIHWNYSAQAITFYNETEMLGKSIQVLLNVERSGLTVLEILNLAEQIQGFNITTIIKRKEQHPVQVNIELSVLKNKANNISGYSLIIKGL